MGIYDRIAQSGEKNYENIRQGFYQRPEEVRANKLADLQLSNAEMKSREYRQASPSRQLSRQAGDAQNQATIDQAEKVKAYQDVIFKSKNTGDPKALDAELRSLGFVTEADGLQKAALERQSKIAEMGKDKQEAIKLSAAHTREQLAADPVVTFDRFEAWRQANPELGAPDLGPGKDPEAYKSSMEFWSGVAGDKKPKDVINLVLPNGEKRGFEKGDPRIGGWLDKGALRIGLGVQAGSLDNLGLLTASQAGKLAQTQMETDKTTRKNILASNDIINMVSSDNFVGGTSGDIVSSINSLRGQFNQLVGSASILTDTGNIDESKVDLSSKNMSRLTKMAVSNDLADAAVIDLAYISAKTRDPAGRISDKDFEWAQKTIARGASKASIINILRANMDRAIRNRNSDARYLASQNKSYKYEPMTKESILGEAEKDASSRAAPIPSEFDNLTQEWINEY